MSCYYWELQGLRCEAPPIQHHQARHLGPLLPGSSRRRDEGSGIYTQHSLSSGITQRKQVCYFNTQKCAKPMSPVSAHCTCAKLEGVLNEHMCYSRSVLMCVLFHCTSLHLLFSIITHLTCSLSTLDLHMEDITVLAPLKKQV